MLLVAAAALFSWFLQLDGTAKTVIVTLAMGPILFVSMAGFFALVASWMSRASGSDNGSSRNPVGHDEWQEH